MLRGKTRSFEREEGMGGGDTSDMMMEPRPSSAFEVVEPELAFHLLVVALYAPPEFREVDHLLERGAERQVRQVELAGKFLAARPFAEEPQFLARRVTQRMAMCRSDSHCCKSAGLRATRALSPRDLSPGRGRQARCDL